MKNQQEIRTNLGTNAKSGSPVVPSAHMYVWTGDRFERHAFHAVLSNLHKRPETIRLWSRFVFVLEGRFRLFALILSVEPH